jgi:hypothetical protein
MSTHVALGTHLGDPQRNDLPHCPYVTTVTCKKLRGKGGCHIAYCSHSHLAVAVDAGGAWPHSILCVVGWPQTLDPPLS